MKTFIELIIENEQYRQAEEEKKAAQEKPTPKKEIRFVDESEPDKNEKPITVSVNMLRKMDADEYIRPYRRYDFDENGNLIGHKD